MNAQGEQIPVDRSNQGGSVIEQGALQLLVTLWPGRKGWDVSQEQIVCAILK